MTAEPCVGGGVWSQAQAALPKGSVLSQIWRAGTHDLPL